MTCPRASMRRSEHAAGSNAADARSANIIATAVRDKANRTAKSVIRVRVMAVMAVEAPLMRDGLGAFVPAAHPRPHEAIEAPVDAGGQPAAADPTVRGGF